MIGFAAAAVLLLGPLSLGLAGLLSARREQETTLLATGWPWKLILLSTLLYVLAFNLTFFIQEFFLVLPKAFLPGVRPTLFHNNHGWEGEHPLTGLFQGTGALATFLVGTVCLSAARCGRQWSATVRLFLVWMAYCGWLMALPQVVIGALNPSNDVGMAMDYLGWGTNAKTAAALAAMVGIVAVALMLVRPSLALADRQEAIASAGRRTRFVFQIATLPAVFGTMLILPFRIPREPIEVVLLPVLVSTIGVVWMQAGAWRVRTAKAAGSDDPVRVAVPLVAVLLLLLVFQWILRPGIRFF